MAQDFEIFEKVPELQKLDLEEIPFDYIKDRLDCYITSEGVLNIGLEGDFDYYYRDRSDNFKWKLRERDPTTIQGSLLFGSAVKGFEYKPKDLNKIGGPKFDLYEYAFQFINHQMKYNFPSYGYINGRFKVYDYMAR